jgi:hypothetical protein
MTSIAWAIVFMAICISDATYTYKFGIDHECGKIMSIAAGISFGAIFICSILEFHK